jgi:hypothetical protein
MTDVHYHFEGDDVFAIHEGRVIASGKADKMDEVESDATNYLKGLKNEKAEKRRRARRTSSLRLASRVRFFSAPLLCGATRLPFVSRTVRCHLLAHGVKDWMHEKTASA